MTDNILMLRMTLLQNDGGAGIAWRGGAIGAFDSTNARGNF
jgi:hypothetical protein